MLDDYLDSPMQAFELLSLEPSSPIKKGKKKAIKHAIEKKTKKVAKELDRWEETWANAS